MYHFQTDIMLIYKFFKMNFSKINFWRLVILFTFFVSASYCQRTGYGYLPKDLSTIRGFNYTAATAEGHAQMWLGYQPDEIEREIDMSRKLNLNQVRVFVPYAPYKANKEAFRKNLLHFVHTCYARGIGVMPVVGYSQEMISDTSYRPQLKEWVAFLVNTLSEEPGLTIWDIKNEPDNRRNPSLGILRYISGVFHELDKKHPITIGMASEQAMEVYGDCVDILSFHDYSSTRELIRTMIGRAKKYAAKVNKPLINSEIGCIGRANPYDMAIEEYIDAGIGWYIWELMITKSRWGPIHGVFYADGSVRDPSIAAAILGIFRNRSAGILPENADQEGRVTQIINQADQWLKKPDSSWEIGLDIAERAANLLEAGQLVSMRLPTTREVLLMRNGSPDLPALHTLLQKYISILEPYKQKK